MKTNCICVLLASTVLAGCGGGSVTPPTSTVPVFATPANLSRAGVGATFTGTQVLNRVTPTQNINLDPDAHDLTISVTSTDTSTPLGAGNASSTAQGDGRATVQIAGLVPNGVEVSTFAGEQDFETRDPTTPRKLGEFVLFDSTNDQIIINFNQEVRLPSGALRYAARTSWTYQQRDATGNVLDAVQGVGVVGFKTPVSALPPGAVDYDVALNVRTYVGSTTDRTSFGGFGTVTLDFATGAVTSNINIGDIVGQVQNGEITGTLTFTNIPGGIFAPGDTVVSGDSGPVIGTVYGPNGEEIGAVFEVQGTNGFAKGTIFGAQ